MRNKRNRIFVIILSLLFAFSTVGEYAFLKYGLPYLSVFVNDEHSEADFSFMLNDRKPFISQMKGMFVNLKEDFDLSLKEDELKKQVDVGIYDACGFDCNAIILTSDFENNLSFDLTEYIITLAKNINMSVGFCVNVNADGKLSKNDINSICNKYEPDFFVVKGINFSDSNSNKLKQNLKNIKEYIKKLSLQCKVGYFLDFNCKSESLADYTEDNLMDFFLWNCDKSSNNAEFLKNAKSFGQFSLRYNIPVSIILHNELVMTGGEWNDASEMLSQLRLSFYNGIPGMVLNSCSSLVNGYKGVSVSIFSFFSDFNNFEYTALDITGFNIKDRVLTVTGTGKQDYPVFLSSSIDGFQQKNVDKNLKFSFEQNLSVGRNVITLMHKNASYSYVIDVAEDLIRNVNVKNDGSNVHIECTSVDGAELYCYLFGEYIEFTAGEIRSDGSRIYYCDYEVFFNQNIQINDVSIGAYLNGISDSMINGVRTPSPYTDNGFGIADTVVVSQDYTQTYDGKNNNDLSVPYYTSQIKGAIGLADKIGLYENNVLYKLSNGMQVSSSNATYIVNGYLMDNNIADAASISNDVSTDITFNFKSLPFTRVVLAPQNYYVGYLSKEYNIKECEFEYVDIILSGVSDATDDIVLSDNPLFKSYEWIKDAKTNDTILRLTLNKKGEFYGYSMTKTGENSLTFSFKHKKALAGCTVLIDAGHGGSGDTGTYSFDGKVYERDITLSIAKKLQLFLCAEGANAILVRTDDYNLNLSTRCDIARRYNPDYVVSIHCDGSDSKSVYGTHSFYYNPFSKPLADSIHKNLVDAYRTYCYVDPASKEYKNCDMSTSFYPFLVTRITECPSVLVECGYLTNGNDQKFLQSENGQNVVAQAIASGILSE